MKKVKLNKNFTIDNKAYISGQVELPTGHYELMKTLDVNGMELIKGSTQIPLISEIETNDKPAKV